MDYRVQDFGRQILILRRDLRFTPQTFGEQTCYVIEDPVSSKFFRVGVPEYTFLSLLDGRTNITDAIRLTTQALGGGGFGDTEALAICRWLVETGLAQTDASTSTARLADAANAGPSRWQAWNPLSLRIPLCYPDRFVERITPATAWLFSPSVAVGVLGLLIYAGYEVGSQWNRFLASSQDVFAAENWFWLALSWVGLKFVHETAHAVVCKKYGGVVREAGIVCILFAPIAYVDVTSSWRFRSKWPRIFTASAGMYIEMLCAAVAALLWSRSEPGTLQNVCFNVATMASVTTLLFNANPLMRFDGYYITSDFLGLPNLYSTSQHWLLTIARRCLLGLPATSPVPDGWLGLFVRGYGIAAMAWKGVVTVGLLIAAATFFHGAGLLIAVLTLATWFVGPVRRLIRYAMRGKAGERPRWGRACGLSTLAIATTTGLLCSIPWPGGTTAPAFVEYSPLTVVRSNSAGFVREIHVRPGQQVQADDVLVVLENRELVAELRDLDLQHLQSETKARQHEQKKELAAVQSEHATQAGLAKQAAEKREQLARLTLRAPVSGQVIGRELDTLLNRYVKEGTELLSLGTDQRKELRASIAQDDIESFATRLGQPIRVRLPGLATSAPLLLDRVTPRASLEPPHASLCAVAGGSLPVRVKESKTADDTDPHEFLTPRFVAYIPLDATQSESLRAGQLGMIALRPFDESIAEHLYRLADRWLRSQWKANGGE